MLAIVLEFIRLLNIYRLCGDSGHCYTYHVQAENSFQDSHKQPCTSSELSYTACLNDGLCFALPSHSEMREVGCQCPDGWTGSRCEMVDFQHHLFADYDYESIQTAKLSASVCLLLLVVAVICRVKSLKPTSPVQAYVLLPKHSQYSVADLEQLIQEDGRMQMLEGSGAVRRGINVQGVADWLTSG